MSEEIPCDVMATARELAAKANECCYRSDGYEEDIREAIARAILAERERTNQDALRYRWLRADNAYRPEEEMVHGGEALDELCDEGIAAAIRSGHTAAMESASPGYSARRKAIKEGE